jgi:hypothetical protein
MHVETANAGAFRDVAAMAAEQTDERALDSCPWQT